MCGKDGKPLISSLVLISTVETKKFANKWMGIWYYIIVWGNIDLER